MQRSCVLRRRYAAQCRTGLAAAVSLYIIEAALAALTGGGRPHRRAADGSTGRSDSSHPRSCK
eukprot:9552425-Heterocapsa_arctica.AAC.1